MRYLNRIGSFVLAIILLMGVAVVNSTAQIRVVRRPVIVQSHFFGDPFWYGGYNPYFYDPYYCAQRQRYYDQQSVNSYSKKMAKDRAKGDLAKLAKDERKYNEAVERLNRDS